MHNSHLGRYADRVYDELRRRIEEGVYAVGIKLPSHATMASEFGVATLTLRQALASLEEDGLVSCEQGRGTFVRSRRPAMRSAALLHAVVNAAQLPIIALSLDRQVLSWNPAAERMFGWREAEVLGKPLPIVPPGKVEEFNAFFARTLAGDPLTNVEIRRSRRDGTDIDLSVSSAPIYDSDMQPIGLMFTYVDITERKRSEAVLRESQARLHAITQSASDGIITVDQQGLIVSWNSGAQRIFGYSELEILHQPLTELMPSRYREAHLSGFNRFLSTGELTRHGEVLELEGLRKDRSEFPLELTLGGWSTSAGSFVSGIVRDSTARRDAETAVQRSQEQFASAFSYAAIGMAVVALNGNWLQVNRSLCDMVGYSEDQLLSLSFQDITYPDDLALDLQCVEDLLAGKINTYQREKRYRHQRGHVVWILLSVSLVHDEHGQPLHFISQLQDITQRKRAEHALRSSENQLRMLVDSSPVGVCIINASGIFEQVNESYATLLGYRVDELVGRHFSLVIPQQQLGTVAQQWTEHLAKRLETLEEFALLRKDGKQVTALTTTVPLGAPDEEQRRATFAIDISDRKRAEEALHHLAHHDALTGLPNRTLLYDRLRQAIPHAQRNGEVLALLFLDLDGFKLVNDRQGHERGDHLLRTVAGLLVAAIRASDTVARLAGDEFVVMLRDVGVADHAATVAKKILGVFQEAGLSGDANRVSVSIGISLFPFDGEDVDTLLTRADEAMYRSKALGKNRVEFYGGSAGFIPVLRAKAPLSDQKEEDVQ